MPGPLTYSPADVMRQLLVDLGLGTNPSASGSWPVYASTEPDTPDNAITVYDTAGRDHGRIQFDGERQEHHGIQVRIRAATYATGYTKARAIAVALDETIYQETVHVSTATYLVHAAKRESDVLSLGKDSPTTKRDLFTVNATISLRQN